jgi:hypothetical protein
MLEPRTIITNREKALINAITQHFPSSTKHILCQWHVSQNMKLKTKHTFSRPKMDPKTTRIVPDEKHQLFLDEWDELLRTPTVERI